MVQAAFLCTQGGKEMWPFARPRPGTASRGKDRPYSITRSGEEYGRLRGPAPARRVGEKTSPTRMPPLDAGQDLKGPVLADNFIVFHVVGFAGVLVADLGAVL